MEFQWLLANPVIERDDDAPGMMQEQRDPSDLLVRPHASLSHHHPCPSRSSQLGWSNGPRWLDEPARPP